jgi:hypothetical protein
MIAGDESPLIITVGHFPSTAIAASPSFAREYEQVGLRRAPAG